MELLALNSRCQCTQQKLLSICAVLTFDPQLKKNLTFSVKDRCQLNYFICIKNFNAETNTSLELNLFSFFICGCQHHQRKTICLYVYISDSRQIVGSRTPVFIQRLPWRLHIEMGPRASSAWRGVRRLCGMYKFKTNPSFGWDVNKTEVPCWKIATLIAR
jgi:hypothetical protein